jgi:hypothetical protein
MTSIGHDSQFDSARFVEVMVGSPDVERTLEEIRVNTLGTNFQVQIFLCFFDDESQKLGGTRQFEMIPEVGQPSGRIRWLEPIIIVLRRYALSEERMRGVEVSRRVGLCIHAVHWHRDHGVQMGPCPLLHDRPPICTMRRYAYEHCRGRVGSIHKFSIRVYATTLNDVLTGRSPDVHDPSVVNYVTARFQPLDDGIEATFGHHALVTMVYTPTRAFANSGQSALQVAMICG